MTLLDTYFAPDFAADGPAPGSDTSLISIGILVDLDRAANKAMVAVNGGSGSWMAMVPGYYLIGGTVFVQRNPFKGGRSELCLGPVTGGDPLVLGRLTAINTSQVRGTVTIDGVSYVLPYIPSTYTAPSDVWVMLSPKGGGTPQIIMGPNSNPPPPPEPDPDPEVPIPTPPPPPPSTISRKATITPSWSGSYRSNRSAWDRWNATNNTYGGRSTLYQGNAYGSGAMKGLATYGNQIANLKALSIEKMVLIIKGAGLSLGSYPAMTFQGSPHGSKPSGAPSSSGATVSGSPGKSGTVRIELPAAMREAFRTGGVKGLCTAGTGYNAVRGTGTAGAMSLEIEYTTAN